MSYGDVGGANSTGGGDYDYCGYGGGYGNDDDTPTYDMAVPTPPPNPEAVKRELVLQEMRNFLGESRTALVNYEKNKFSVKARPFNEDIYKTDMSISDARKSLQGLADSADSTERYTVLNRILTLSGERQRLQTAEHAITVEKLRCVDLINLYIDKRTRYCMENNPCFRPDYNPHKDVELQRRLKEAKAYEEDYHATVIKERDLEAMFEAIKKNVNDYGVSTVQQFINKRLGEMQ